MRLKERVALVVGGARGMGRESCIEMAKEGAFVAVADRQEQEAEELSSELKKMGAKAIAIKIDVTQPEEITEMMHKVLSVFGQINVLFHTAGWGNFHPFWEISRKEWDHMIAVNLTGAFFVSQAVAKQMLAQKKGGRIILTGSGGAVQNCNQLAHYCATKAAVGMLTKCMASELGNFRINVNVINPGCIETTMTRPMISDPKYKRMLESKTPLGRWGQASEIAKLVVFLASDDASFINGQAINIDGGISLPSVPAWFPLDYTKENEVDWEKLHKYFPFLAD